MAKQINKTYILTTLLPQGSNETIIVGLVYTHAGKGAFEVKPFGDEVIVQSRKMGVVVDALADYIDDNITITAKDELIIVSVFAPHIISAMRDGGNDKISTSALQAFQDVSSAASFVAFESTENYTEIKLNVLGDKEAIAEIENGIELEFDNGVANVGAVEFKSWKNISGKFRLKIKKSGNYTNYSIPTSFRATTGEIYTTSEAIKALDNKVDFGNSNGFISRAKIYFKLLDEHKSGLSNQNIVLKY